MTVKSEKPMILVTGSAGLIGTRTLEALSSNYSVVGMDVKRPEKIVAGTGFVPSFSATTATEGRSTFQSSAPIRGRFGNFAR